MEYIFFLSYASADREDDPLDVIGTFYDDVCRAIRKSTHVPDTTEVGFLDTGDVKSGESWTSKVADALASCRVFVPMLSPVFFTRPYCGKEWTVFRRRLQEAAGDGAGVPPLIQPVLLSPPRALKSMPEDISEDRYDDDSYPDLYRKQGLDRLRQLREDVAYNKFVLAFADRVVSVSEEHPLPPLAAGVPAFREVEEAFPKATPAKAAASPASKRAGPRFVQFVFVAGRRDELEQIRAATDGYGDQDGLQWRPWLKEDIWQMVTDVARQEGLVPEFALADAELLDRVKQAIDDLKIVVLVVDTWTLRRDDYRERVALADAALNRMYSVVVVLWNELDTETAGAHDVLEDVVAVTFGDRYAMQNPHTFLHPVSSAKQLRDRLAAAMVRTSSWIREDQARRKRLAADRPAIVKPEIGTGEVVQRK